MDIIVLNKVSTKGHDIRYVLCLITNRPKKQAIGKKGLKIKSG